MTVYLCPLITAYIPIWQSQYKNLSVIFKFVVSNTERNDNL